MTRVAASLSDIARELAERTKGLPRGAYDGDRVVPVSYDVTLVPLETREEYEERDELACSRAELRKATIAAPGVHTTAYRYFVHAQQSDDGVAISFMTPSERSLASLEWGQRLRDLIEAGKKRDERKGPSVYVDLDWDE